MTQDDLRAFDAQHQIATEAWSPIAQGKVLDDAVIERIARRVERSTAQVVLRWHIQRGDIVFPKSVTAERVKANFEIFDFELSDADLGDISALNRDERTGPDPDTFNYIRKEPVSEFSLNIQVLYLTLSDWCLRSNHPMELPYSHVVMEDWSCHRHW